jgi:hypothetical protein
MFGFALIFDQAAAATSHCQGSALVQGPCVGIRGTLQWWRNLPPFLRIESDGMIYGIWPPERENVPKVIKDLAPYSTRGVYVLCPLGQVTRLPYYENPIELYCIAKATINEREIRTSRKRLIWTRLPKPLISYN